MKQGISLFSFTDSTDVRWMFEHAKKAGYDGVEPVMSESGYLNPATPEKDILAMRRMAEDMGLETPAWVCGACGRTTLSPTARLFGKRPLALWNGKLKLHICWGRTLFWLCRAMWAVLLHQSRRRFVTMWPMPAVRRPWQSWPACTGGGGGHWH